MFLKKRPKKRDVSRVSVEEDTAKQNTRESPGWRKINDLEMVLSGSSADVL